MWGREERKTSPPRGGFAILWEGLGIFTNFFLDDTGGGFQFLGIVFEEPSEGL